VHEDSTGKKMQVDSTYRTGSFEFRQRMRYNVSPDG
jgi:hypothetical protein